MHGSYTISITTRISETENDIPLRKLESALYFLASLHLVADPWTADFNKLEPLPAAQYTAIHKTERWRSPYKMHSLE